MTVTTATYTAEWSDEPRHAVRAHLRALRDALNSALRHQVLANTTLTQEALTR